MLILSKKKLKIFFLQKTFLFLPHIEKCTYDIYALKEPMKKSLLHIILMFLLAFVPALQISATESSVEDISMAAEPITSVRITVKNGSVNVQNAAGQIVEVFSVTGKKIASEKIASADETFDFNLSRGCYIVKVGKVVRKVSVL